MNMNTMNDMTSSASATATKLKNEGTALATKLVNDATNVMNDVTSSATSTATKAMNNATDAATKVKNDATSAKNQVTVTAREIQRGDVHMDPAESTYEFVKDVWVLMKRIIIVRTFMAIAEKIAGKTLSIFGTSLGSVDGGITSNLQAADDKLLNPAIRMVVNGIYTILRPFGVIKKDINSGEDPLHAVKKEGNHLMKEGGKNFEYMKEEGEKMAPELTTKGRNMVKEGEKNFDYLKNEGEKMAPEYTTKRGNIVSAKAS